VFSATPSASLGTGPATFGVYTVDAAMGDGRFGPVFHAHDTAGLSVVVRTFAQPFGEGERTRLIEALTALCRTPLEHPAIARPVTCGLQDGRPYLIHTYLSGTSLADYVTASGQPSLREVLMRVTHVAGALDFAAAAGVIHGALSARDIIFSSDAAGISGFGLVQALEAAGVPGVHARREDDLRSLAEITRELIGIDVPGTFLTALEFAGALQHAVTAVAPVEAPMAPAIEREAEVVPAPEPELARIDDFALPLDVAIRDEPQGLVAEAPTLPLPSPAPPASMFGSAAEVAPHRAHRWLIVPALALIVAVGLVIGFSGGFLGQRPAPPETQAAATAPVVPTPPSGQVYTDAPVEQPKPPPVPPAPAPPIDQRTPAVTPAPVPAAPTPAQRSAPRRTTPVPPAVTEPPRSGPAAMRVESLPAGAQVFVDGRSVGYTPLVVGGLIPGTHSVRMQIPGYHPWVTAVTLGPGARERVAASLEQ
jgi:serine/threonine-protein kinase